jgi:hypothetical protein
VASYCKLPTGPTVKAAEAGEQPGKAKVGQSCGGLQFLSLTMLLIGVPVAIGLAHAAKALRAPPGSGYT